MNLKYTYIYCFCAVDTRYGGYCDIVHTGADAYTRLMRVPRVLCTNEKKKKRVERFFYPARLRDCDHGHAKIIKKVAVCVCVCVARALYKNKNFRERERGRERAVNAAPSSVNSKQ